MMSPVRGLLPSSLTRFLHLRRENVGRRRSVRIECKKRRELVWACTGYNAAAAAVLSHMTAGSNHDVILPFYLSLSESPDPSPAPYSCGRRASTQSRRKVERVLFIQREKPGSAGLTPAEKTEMQGTDCVWSRQDDLHSPPSVSLFKSSVLLLLENQPVCFLNSLSRHSNGRKMGQMWGMAIINKSIS